MEMCGWWRWCRRCVGGNSGFPQAAVVLDRGGGKGREGMRTLSIGGKASDMISQGKKTLETDFREGIKTHSELGISFDSRKSQKGKRGIGESRRDTNLHGGSREGRGIRSTPPSGVG